MPQGVKRVLLATRVSSRAALLSTRAGGGGVNGWAGEAGVTSAGARRVLGGRRPGVPATCRGRGGGITYLFDLPQVTFEVKKVTERGFIGVRGRSGRVTRHLHDGERQSHALTTVNG